MTLSISGVVADENVVIPDNMSDSTILIKEEETKPPGFEAVFAVAGLLAVAYVVMRQRED